jgi:DNA repair protein RadA/Sms
MAKSKTSYHCRNCGGVASKWSGQCADCGEWNTLEESVSVAATGKTAERFQGYAGTAAITSIADVDLSAEPRFGTGLSELDRALGGGVVAGSVTLIGGDPGIGKSTLLLQCMASLSANYATLYVTGEESLQQVSLRARRLGLPVKNLRLLTETCVESISQHALKDKPQVMVIDSIQTVYTQLLQSAPGSVAQVRESAAHLVRFAKQHNVAMFVVGHVTKEGALAGPRVLEHMVDTVLYFEGDTNSRYRVIRAIKNRFGAVNELGVFVMEETGLKGVKNPSGLFLSRHDEPVAGSVIMITREGSRPLLVEAQALVTASHSSYPRRVTVGLEQNRLNMLLAVLQRHASITMHDQDVFINIVGGVRISETAADLPVLLAAMSSYRDIALDNTLAVFGEVGLSGEVRPVANGQERLAEAAKHGITKAIVPHANRPRTSIEGLEVVAAKRLTDALEQL